MLQNGIKILEICSGKKTPNNSAHIYYSHFSRVTLDNLAFSPQAQEHLTDTRLVPLESRRASLPRYYESEAKLQILAVD